MEEGNRKERGKVKGIGSGTPLVPASRGVGAVEKQVEFPALRSVGASGRSVRAVLDSQAFG